MAVHALAVRSPPTPLLNRFTDQRKQSEDAERDTRCSRRLRLASPPHRRSRGGANAAADVGLALDPTRKRCLSALVGSRRVVERVRRQSGAGIRSWDNDGQDQPRGLHVDGDDATLGPIGIERWPYELALKYGIRDALTCCVGQRWLVAYWSRQVLTNVLTQPLRLLLIAAAGFAAQRLEQVIGDDPRQVGDRPPITPRELAVLRLVSLGRRTNEVAKLLGIGEETVRSHLKKVQIKLGVRNRAHAAAEAVRRQLIP